MKRLCTIALSLVALLFLGCALPPSNSVNQQKTLKEQVIGTWIYVSVDTVRPDGSRIPMFGPNPRGRAIFDGNGRYALMTSRSDLPKFASNNRVEGTPEEYTAIVKGFISHFGKYTVNEADGTISFNIENSSFPNWNGTEQKRPFTINGDELKWTTAGSSGGTAEVVLKRAR